jgi:hypothetical protein
MFPSPINPTFMTSLLAVVHSEVKGRVFSRPLGTYIAYADGATVQNDVNNRFIRVWLDTIPPNLSNRRLDYKSAPIPIAGL